VRVKDLMRTRNLASARSDDDLAVASQLMRWAGVRHLPVLGQDDQVVGVMTERDVLRASGGGGSVSDFMSTPAQVIGPEDEVATACALMVAHKIGCLPVVDDTNNLVGIVTTADLLGRQFSSELGSAAAGAARVSVAMQRQPATAHPYSPLLEAVAIMVDRGVRHVPVVDDHGRLVGIVSDRDVRTAIGDPVEALHEELTELEEMKVSGVMSTDMITTSEDAPVAEVARLFIQEKIGAMPVVDSERRLLGIVSYVDLIRALLVPIDARGETDVLPRTEPASLPERRI
jgi:CBS domain-containing protein